MMKNIILIDPDLEIFNQIIELHGIEIHHLIVSNEKQKEELALKYALKVYSVDGINEFYKNYTITLDYTLIQTFRETQLKVEHFLNRVTTDINLIQYIYYSALSYWYNVFQEKKIDYVISNMLEWGTTFDSIIYDVAVHFGVNVFLIEGGLTNGSNLSTGSVFHYNSKEYISLETVSLNLTPVKLSNYVYYSIAKKKQKSIGWKKKIISAIEKTGGFLLLSFLNLIRGKFEIKHHSFQNSWMQYFLNFLHSKMMIKYYDSLSGDIEPEQKFIFYALHMEPEAATLARTTYSNQLIIIKTLSQSLPHGWKLYVKEHPHQFKNLNNTTRYYFLTSLNRFKTKSYYDEINALENVSLLKLSIKSSELINLSEAIATINGTIALEAMLQKKPLLMFSQNTSPFKYINDVFDIQTSAECDNAIEKIYDNFTPDYSDLEDTIQRYIFEVDSNKIIDYKLLIEYLVEGLPPQDMPIFKDKNIVVNV